MTDPVTRVASDLSAILEMAKHLDDQAEHRSDDPLMPGGLAMVALAPVANQEAWTNVYEAAEHFGKPTSHIEDEDDTWEPPLQTLCFWSEQWRVELGGEYETQPRATVESEARYIRAALDWAWDHEAQFDDFAKDVNRARRRMENVLYAGKRNERTRVPCTNDDCEKRPMLIKVYAWNATDDHFKCMACKERYSQEQFARAKLRLLDSEGADRYVKAQDAREAIDRPERTFRKWIEEGIVRSHRDPIARWVWWPDVRDADLATERRKRGA